MSEENDAVSATAFAAGVATATAAEAAATSEESEARSEVALDVAQSAHERVDQAQATAEGAAVDVAFTRDEMNERFAQQDAKLDDTLGQIRDMLAAAAPPAQAEDDRAPAPPPHNERQADDAVDQADGDDGDSGGGKPKRDKKKRGDGFSASFFGRD